MNIHPGGTGHETNPATRSSSSSILPLRNSGCRPAKVGSGISKGETCSTNAVIPELPTATEERGGGLAPLGVIIDFATARSRGVAQAQEKLSNEIDTLTDWMMLAYVVASVAFYPALIWFFVS
jgi:hypothetical protein